MSFDDYNLVLATFYCFINLLFSLDYFKHSFYNSNYYFSSSSNLYTYSSFLFKELYYIYKNYISYCNVFIYYYYISSLSIASNYYYLNFSMPFYNYEIYDLLT